MINPCLCILNSKSSSIKKLVDFWLITIKKQIYFRKSVPLYLSYNDEDDSSKKVIDYNINENQFAIEYIAIFEDGTCDSYIEDKIIRTATERLPIWVEDIKKEEKSKKEKTKNS